MIIQEYCIIIYRNITTIQKNSDELKINMKTKREVRLQHINKIMNHRNSHGKLV